MDGETAPPLSAVHVNKPLVAVNRVMAAVHAALVAAVIGQRALTLLSAAGAAAVSRNVAMVLADLTLLFLWALSQSGLWRPVRRAVFPERLVAAVPRSALPGVDVLVVTADPDKEPALGVMNTVVSAMALDYPAGRLSVYLSDDAGSPLTLLAARKAYAFAKAWVPFCRRHSVHCPWPDRYFAGDDGHDGDRRELVEEKEKIKKMYDKLKAGIEAASKDESISGSWTKAKRQDHDAHVEMMSNEEDEDGEEMPVLVYVAREKRRSWPHHFKAGALNVLLRVSGVVSNAAYVLVLDCDMACNSRSSALEAMCFHLDRRRCSSNLAFVQFPQMFHNLSDKDIYTNELRYVFQTRWFGLDGVRGPLLSGTGFYVRRDALYGATPPAGDLAGELRPSRWFQDEAAARATAQAQLSFDEAGTGWGHDVGFMYQSVVEDYFTGFKRFFARGWTSAYCYPEPRPAFLGAMPTNLNDVLVQNKRWMSGMLAPTSASRASTPSPCSATPRCRSSASSAASRSSPAPPHSHSPPPRSPHRCCSTWWRCASPSVASRCARGGTSRGSGSSTPSPASSSAASAPPRSCSAPAPWTSTSPPRPPTAACTSRASSTSPDAPRCCSLPPRSPCSTPPPSSPGHGDGGCPLPPASRSCSSCATAPR